MEKAWHVRDEVVSTPVTEAQKSTLVGTPDGSGAFCCKIPKHGPAVSIARQQARVVAHEAHGMDLGRVAAEHVSRLGGRAFGLLQREGGAASRGRAGHELG